MFDTVGKNIDEEANKRRAATLVLLACIGGTVVAISFACAAWQAARALGIDVPELPEFEDMIAEVEVEIEDVLPPPPPPPPPPAGAEDEEEEEEEEEEEPEEETPDDMVDPQELEDPPDTSVADSTPERGQEGGVEGGEEGGVIGGTIGGEVGGVIGGTLGGQVATVHRSEVRIKRPIQPDYPAAARDMNLGQVDCRVRIFINEKGEPTDMRFEACPSVFHENTRSAVMRMRWYPYRVGGQKAAAQFVIKFRFQPGR